MARDFDAYWPTEDEAAAMVAQAGNDADAQAKVEDHLLSVVRDYAAQKRASIGLKPVPRK